MKSEISKQKDWKTLMNHYRLGVPHFAYHVPRSSRWFLTTARSEGITEEAGKRYGLPKRVLLLEDTEQHQARISAALRAAGMDVVGIAKSVQEGRSMYRLNRPDFILLDEMVEGDQKGSVLAKELLAGGVKPEQMLCISSMHHLPDIYKAHDIPGFHDKGKIEKPEDTHAHALVEIIRRQYMKLKNVTTSTLS